MAALEDQDHPTPRSAWSVPQQAFHDTLTVRSYEVGRDGVIRPGVVLRYLEHLATRASGSLGFDNRWYNDRNGAWVVREMSLLIGDLPRIDDDLRLATWVADFRRVQAMRDYLIDRADTGRMVVRATARWAYIDRERLAPMRIPEEITARMGPWGHAMRPRQPISQPDDAQAIAETRLTAREYEADTQQHVNNGVYLDWFDEAAQQAAASGALTGAPVLLRPRFYRLEYIRPALPGDALVVTTMAPVRARSRGLGFWQTITVLGDACASEQGGVIARAWTESLFART